MKTKWAIEQKRNWYGPRTTIGLYLSRYSGEPVVGSKKEMMEIIKDRDNEIYYTDHNEASRPELRPVMVGSRAYNRAARNMGIVG